MRVELAQSIALTATSSEDLVLKAAGRMLQQFVDETLAHRRSMRDNAAEGLIDELNSSYESDSVLALTGQDYGRELLYDAAEQYILGNERASMVLLMKGIVQRIDALS